MSCETCENKSGAVASVPLYSVEGERYAAKSSITVLIVCLVLVACLTAGTLAFCYKVNKDCLDKVEAINRYWIDYISQYDFESYTYEQDGQGLNIIGDRNGVDYYVPEADGTPEA